jgi:quercetin dioxygenase-like cupin family protein
MFDPNPVNWGEMEWEVVRPGVKRKVFHGRGCTMVLNYLEPGHQPRPHKHAHEQLVYIVQGEGNFTIGSKAYRLRSGSLLAVPPDAEHFLQVLGSETCIDLDVFVPKREDYMESPMKGQTYAPKSKK